MDADIEVIKGHLEEFCLSGDDNVLIKMKELCFVYQCTEEDVVDQWVAFSTSKKLNRDPTVVMLEKMEREEMMKTKNAKQKKSSSLTTTPIYNSKTIDLVSNEIEIPEKDLRRNTQNLNASLVFSPSSMTPTRFTPSKKYGSRPGSGDVVCSFGNIQNAKWDYSDEFSCNITAYREKTALKSSYHFMSEKLRDRASILNDMIQETAELYSKVNEIEEWGHIQLPSAESVPVVGRISSDGTEKISPSTLYLEGSQELSSGQVVPLDVSALENFSFFPGQIIAGKGRNNLGKKLILESLYDGIYPEQHLKPPDMPNCFDSLGVVIAVGPFATSDTLSYDPLWDLMKQVKTQKPHVVILIGPFVDVKNPLIENGELNETYDDVFKNLLIELLDHTEELSTKVVLVPSLRDAHHDCVYPTPPFLVSHAPKRLYLASDPCILNIEGVIFAITSTDILFHLGKEEISYLQPPDRLGRLCKHILLQRNFYPLYPPNEDMNIDFLRYELHAGIPVMPHILIVPSDFRYFIKDIGGCCCINPERLTKYSTGGTFARLKVNRIDDENYKGSVIESIQAQIVKI